MQERYNTGLDAMNIFVKNRHLLAKIRSVLKESTFLLLQNIKNQL